MISPARIRPTIREILTIEKANSAMKVNHVQGCVAVNGVKDHTFSKVTHTEDINHADQDANECGVNRHMFCLKRDFLGWMDKQRRMSLSLLTLESQNERRITAAVISDGREML